MFRQAFVNELTEPVNNYIKLTALFFNVSAAQFAAFQWSLTSAFSHISS